MKKFRIHILGVPHTQTHKDFVGCAFTQKVWKFLKMMSGRGHQIYHYGHERRDWDYPDVEAVTVTDDRVLAGAYGTEYTEQQSWRSRGFAEYYDITDSAYQHFHAVAIKEIQLRKQPGDILLCPFGWGHKPIADAHPDLIAIESGIGYGSTCLRWRVFESSHMRSAAGGLAAVNHPTVDLYDRVIPNYFDAADFDYQEHKQNYILYLGRITASKGVNILLDLAKYTEKTIIIGGQGTVSSLGYTRVADNVVELGYCDQEQRRILMSNAQALFIGSGYAEPFAGVQVEAWLSGTPVISPDHSCFVEMNQHNITGYRCRTFRDYVQAINSVEYLNPIQCRLHGERYLLDRIAPEYEQYFRDVEDVYLRQGWYTLD